MGIGIHLMKKLLLFTLLLLAAFSLRAQSGSPIRLEIPAPAGSAPFNYMTAGKNGVCLFYPTINPTSKDSVSWSFMMTDDQLKDKWNLLVPLHKDVTFLKSLSTTEAIYLLFHDTKQNKDGNIFVFMIIPRLQVITEHRAMIPDKAEVVDFDISNNIAYIGYNNRKDQPGIIGFSLVTGEKQTYTITAEKDALLLDLSIDEGRHEIFAAYKIQFSSSKNHLLVNQYNLQGKLEKTFDFPEQVDRKNFNSAQYIPTGDGSGIIAGTYGFNVSNSRRQYDYYDNYYNSYYYNYYSPFYYSRQSNYDANFDKTPVSDGYFTATVNQGVAGKIRYYNFSGFSNAFKYITDPSALRVKKKPARKRGKSEDTEQTEDTFDNNERTLNLRLLTHEVLMDNGQFIITSEAYSPEYHTNTQMSYDFYGRAFPTSYQVFDGFRYSHAFVAGFDSSGNMAWNNGMEMRDILTKYLNRKLNCTFENNEMVLFYNANNKVAFKTIKGNTIVDNTSYTSLIPLRGTDQPIDEYLGTIEHWYDDYFIATGYQTIRNNYLESNKRNVFYISKMAFR